MATPELVAAQAATPITKGITEPLRERFHNVWGKSGWLNRYVVEREEPILMMGLCAIAGVDYMLLGPPGAGKTYAIELMVEHCLVDMELFTHMLAKDQSADEILGTRSLQGLKEDKIRRQTAGMLPEANFGYLDEFFKASPPTLNPMLDIMATRKLKVGGHVINCDKLISIAMSSNELPTGREDLTAMRDRIDVTMKLENVKTPEGWRKVIDVQCEIEEHGLDKTGLEPWALPEILQVRSEVRGIVLPPKTRSTLTKALEGFAKADHLPSMRRVDRMRRMMKAAAWHSARTEVAADDLWPVQHMAWSDETDAKSAEDVVADFLGQFTQQARVVRRELEPVLRDMTKLTELSKAGNTAEHIKALTEAGTPLLNKLREIQEECQKLIAEGTKDGHDVRPVQEVLDEVNGAYKWAYDVVSGALQP